MLQMEVNDVRDKVYTAERNEELEAANLWQVQRCGYVLKLKHVAKECVSWWPQ